MDYLQITDEIILMFKEEPTAMIIWLDVLLQIKKDSSFIPRREYIKNKFNLGDFKTRRALKFLKDHGLVVTSPTYFKGRLKGAKFKFYTLENAVNNPSPTTTPGPQAKTRIIAEKNQKSPLNGNKSECVKIKHSEIIQGEKSNLIRFNSSNPDEHKKVFLEYFPGQNTFQTFDDSTKKRRHLSKIYQKYNAANLDAKNNNGAGVYLTINETDGKGRSKKNIIRVRAVFADLDGAPLEPVFKYNPSMIIESSPGRYHSYWLTDNVPLGCFTELQKAIAIKFESDPKVKDLPRVMRMPGYYHYKNEPVLSRVIYTSGNKYSFSELKSMFPEIPKTGNRLNQNNASQINGTRKGERNDKLCRMMGGMIKKNIPSEIIKKRAYQFADSCTPPLSKNQVLTTFRATTHWTAGNEY